MSTAPYQDGTFTTAKQNGPRIPSYPFGNAEIPDIFPVQYDRNFIVLPESYSPQMANRTSCTNILTQSSNFSHADWSASAITVSTANAPNPWNGATTVDKLNESVANAVHGLGQSVTYAAASYVCFAVVRGGLGRDWILLRCPHSGNTPVCYFNITTGAIGTASGGASAFPILALTGGYYLIGISFTASAGAGSANAYVTTGDGVFSAYAGDVTKGFYFGQFYVGTGSSYPPLVITTTAPRTVSSPNLEANETIQGADPFAFLVNESVPALNLAEARFSRRYARVPGDQVIPSYQFVDRPVMHNIKSGTSYFVSFDDLQNYSWRFDSRKSVTRVSSVNAQTVAGAMPVGNLTFIEGGRTLNIAANSSAAAIVAGFNATLTGLTNVAANASTGFLSIVWTGTMTSIAAPSGVLIASVSYYQVTFQATGTQTFPATTTFTAASHGGVVGDRVALWSGDALAGTGIVVSVGDANNFTVMTNNLDSANTLVTHCAFSSSATACYVNGQKLCPVRRTQKFYLPGVTTGITTYSDIPTITIYTDPVAWAGRILAASTYAAVAVAELKQWQGPILVQETSEAQMASAVTTVTPVPQ